MFKWFSAMSAGLVAVIVGYTSSVAIVFQAAAAAGATPAQVSSWLLALGVGLAATCIGFSLYYRLPILTAWSTPGAAFLATSLLGTSMPEAMGAFIFSAALITLAGITGFFEKTMRYIPRALASAMLAGILLHFGINIFVAMQHQVSLVIVMLLSYLLVKRLLPRYVILIILLLGICIVGMQGQLHFRQLHLAMSVPVFTMPVFSLSALISIGIPLFIITMTSQNVPGIATIQASGYQPPISSIISWTGVTNMLLAPFGGFSINLAAITAAICLSKEADIDPGRRYRAVVFAGLFYLIAGLFGATVVALFFALPSDLILSLAGLALLTTIANSLKQAMEDDSQREPALITFLVAASGITLAGVGAACWGLVAGTLAYLVLSTDRDRFLAGNRTMFHVKQLISRIFRKVPN